MELKSILKSALEHSINDAFTTTLSLSPEPSDEEFQDGGGVVSSIGFTGSIEGNLVMSFSDESACAVVSKMIGMELGEVDSDVCDGVGEVVNMVIGGIKMKIAEKNYTFEIGIPTTVTGQALKISSTSETLTKINYNFICENIKFSVVFLYKLHEKKEGVAEPAKQEEKKINPLDLLNQAVAKSEQDEKSLSEKTKVAKPCAADLLSQLVGNAGSSATAPVKAEGEITKKSVVEEKKPDPLDLLNQAVAKSEHNEDSSSEKTEVAKPDAADLLNQLVGSANSSATGPVKAEEGITKESVVEEKKPDPLDLLNQAVAKSEHNKDSSPEKMEVKISAVDVLNQAVTTTEKNVQENESQKGPIKEKPEEKGASQEKMGALEKLDQAMKQFKEIS